MPRVPKLKPELIKVPKTVKDIDQMIKNHVQESLHLDYKQSAAIDSNKRHEISKDVSAFANSDGGLIIYGVVEQDHMPVRKDSGVDHKKYSKEWLEQVILSNVSPRISDLRISQIKISPNGSIYSVQIPKSVRGPHQAADKKFYKRFEFQSVPMEYYEIEDVRNRIRIIPPLLNIDFDFQADFLVYLTLKNIGKVTAEKVSINLPSTLKKWAQEKTPTIFTKGIKFLPPGRSLSFLYGSYPALTSPNSDLPVSFEIKVLYFHPEASHRISEKFHLDLMDYFHSTEIRSETYRKLKEGAKSLEKLVAETKKLNGNIEELGRIADATGLRLSVNALRNLKNVISGKEFEKIDPTHSDPEIIREILGVDIQMAVSVWEFFHQYAGQKKLSEVKGMNPELSKKIKKFFQLNEETQGDAVYDDPSK